MKNIIKLFGIALLCFFINEVTNAQALVEDQNPNFYISIDKYSRLNDSLPNTMGVTLQDTYKAYDWYEAKLQRRALRKERRYQIRLARAMYGNDYYYPSFGSYFYNPFSYWNTGWGWGIGL